jgi:hypothetical protein
MLDHNELTVTAKVRHLVTPVTKTYIAQGAYSSLTGLHDVTAILLEDHQCLF